MRNETRGAVFKKQQFITVCYSTRGAFFKKQQFITVWYSTCVRIEMKQEGQFSKKIPTIYYSMLFNKRGIFQKTTIYHIVINWIFLKTTVWYSTCVRIEMKQDGQLSKKSNWWQYATELVREMKQEGQFSKLSLLFHQQFITVCYSTCVRIEMKQEGQFSKTKQKTSIYYSILFNKRGSFEKQQFITVWYSTCVHIEMKQEGQFSTTKKNTNLLQYAIQLVRVLKWNKMVSFQKNPINDNMLLNLCAKWNKRGSFQKTTIYYCMLFNLCP